MVEQLWYVHLPELLDDLKAIQKKVDNRHTNCNIATVSGCAASIAGGSLCIIGIIASPFTFGISLGFTAAGSALVVAGSVSTTTAKTVDFARDKWDQRKTNKKIKEFLGHYEAAKKAYEKILQINQTLTEISVQPDVGARNTITMKAIINGIKSAAEYAVALRRVPVVTVTGGVKAFTVYQALVVPAKLHAATKLALSPHKTVSHAHHCCKEMINGVKFIAELEGSEFRVAGMASLRAGCCALQAAGCRLQEA